MRETILSPDLPWGNCTLGVFCLISMSPHPPVGGWEGMGTGEPGNGWTMLGKSLPLFCKLSLAVNKGCRVVSSDPHFGHQMCVIFPC